MNTINRKCETCQVEFNAAVKEVNRGNARYCSLSCSARRRRMPKQPNCTCSYCGAEFYRSSSKIAASKSGFLFCSRNCKELAQSIGDAKFDPIRPDHYSMSLTDYRKIAFDSFPHRCNRCGFDKYPVWHVHHVDRDRTNNKLFNLEILCPTCHEIEHYVAQDSKWSQQPL